jgi:hypothetical protein
MPSLYVAKCASERNVLAEYKFYKLPNLVSSTNIWLFVMTAIASGNASRTSNVIRCEAESPPSDSRIDPPHHRTVVRHYDAEDNLEGTEITTIEADTENMRRSSSETASDPTSGPSAASPRSPKLNRNAPLSPKQQRRRPGAGSLMAPRL